MIAGKYDWFCDMKCRSDSEKIMRATSFMCTGDSHFFIMHTIKPSYFVSLMNWDYFHLGLFSYINESHFELNTFSSTSTQQFKK